MYTGDGFFLLSLIAAVTVVRSEAVYFHDSDRSPPVFSVILVFIRKGWLLMGNRTDRLVVGVSESCRLVLL